GGFEVVAVAVHGADHYLIAKHELQVDLVGGHPHSVGNSCNAGQDQHSILAKGLHSIEYYRRESARLDDDVEGTVLLRGVHQRSLLGAYVARCQLFHEVRVEIRLWRAGESSYFQPAQAQGHRGEQAY